MKIVSKTEPYISHIKYPVFIVQGALDGIVPSTTAQYLYDEIPAKRNSCIFQTVENIIYVIAMIVTNGLEKR